LRQAHASMNQLVDRQKTSCRTTTSAGASPCTGGGGEKEPSQNQTFQEKKAERGSKDKVDPEKTVEEVWKGSEIKGEGEAGIHEISLKTEKAAAEIQAYRNYCERNLETLHENKEKGKCAERANERRGQACCTSVAKVTCGDGCILRQVTPVGKSEKSCDNCHTLQKDLNIVAWCDAPPCTKVESSIKKGT